MATRDWNRIITVCAVAGLLIQASSTVWWASKIEQRVFNLEDKANKSAAITQTMEVRAARIEERLDSICRNYGKLEGKLDSMDIKIDTLTKLFERHLGADDARRDKGGMK